MNLKELLEQAVTGTDKASPVELTDVVLSQLSPSDYREALEKTLPVYVRSWLSERRVWKEAGEEPGEAYFAPDDLLSDDVAEIETERQKTVIRSRGRSKAAAARTEWQRHFSDSLWNGERFIKFGDATAADLVMAASSMRSQAKAEFDGKMRKAEWYEKIAANLLAGDRVRDLSGDPTRV